MVEKISKCVFFQDLNIRPSSFKGVHIEIFCGVDCDMCRICYDDTRRFNYDMKRPYYARDILFNEKEKITLD